MQQDARKLEMRCALGDQPRLSCEGCPKAGDADGFDHRRIEGATRVSEQCGPRESARAQGAERRDQFARNPLLRESGQDRVGGSVGLELDPLSRHLSNLDPIEKFARPSGGLDNPENFHGSLSPDLVEPLQVIEHSVRWRPRERAAHDPNRPRTALVSRQRRQRAPHGVRPEGPLRAHTTRDDEDRRRQMFVPQRWPCVLVVVAPAVIECDRTRTARQGLAVRDPGHDLAKRQHLEMLSQPSQVVPERLRRDVHAWFDALALRPIVWQNAVVTEYHRARAVEALARTPIRSERLVRRGSQSAQLGAQSIHDGDDNAGECSQSAAICR